MKDFSKITSPLTNLLKKTTMFECSDKYEEAFQEFLNNNAYSDLTHRWKRVHYLASKNELGCVQMQDDNVIAYAFRQLKPYEKSYPNHDLELAAMVFCHENLAKLLV